MDGFTDTFEGNDVDPAAEFLAREQNNLAGLEDEIKPVVPNGISNDANEGRGLVILILIEGENGLLMIILNMVKRMLYYTSYNSS